MPSSEKSQAHADRALEHIGRGEPRKAQAFALLAIYDQLDVLNEHLAAGSPDKDAPQPRCSWGEPLRDAMKEAKAAQASRALEMDKQLVDALDERPTETAKFMVAVRTDPPVVRNPSMQGTSFSLRSGPQWRVSFVRAATAEEAASLVELKQNERAFVVPADQLSEFGWEMGRVG